MELRTNWLTAILAVSLLASIMVSGTLMSANDRSNAESAEKSTRLQMNDVLGKAQMAAQAEIKKVDKLVCDIGPRIAPYGLNGTQVKAELNATLALDPYIMDIITYGRDGIVVAVEPAGYEYMVGLDLSGADNVARLLSTKMPIMSNVLPPIEGERGAVFAAPVFDLNGTFIGGVSALFNVSSLLDHTLPQLANGTTFTFWCMQMDGMDIYDTDHSQIGMNIIHGSDYAAFPQVQAIGWRMVNESTGYGTYSYFVSLSTQQVVTKQCYWTTIGSHGIQWRLVLVQRM